jgi:hypothetical protein
MNDFVNNSWNNYKKGLENYRNELNPPPTPAAKLRRQQYLNSVPGGITPGSILDKNLYDDAGWRNKPNPFPEKKYEEYPGGYIRTTKGEKEYQNDLKNYEKSVIRKFKDDQWGGRKRKSRKARKSRKSRKSRKARKSRRR